MLPLFHSMDRSVSHATGVFFLNHLGQTELSNLVKSYIPCEVTLVKSPL